jgi:hypothetical protein
MFISYELKKYLDLKNGECYLEYQLIDSEFGTVSGICGMVSLIYGGAIEVVVAVIQEYSKRNLNVAANLAIALIWWWKQYPRWSIQQLIDDNKRCNPLFKQYEEDLRKYLALL